MNLWPALGHIVNLASHSCAGTDQKAIDALQDHSARVLQAIGQPSRQLFAVLLSYTSTCLILGTRFPFPSSAYLTLVAQTALIQPRGPDREPEGIAPAPLPVSVSVPVLLPSFEYHVRALPELAHQRPTISSRER